LLVASLGFVAGPWQQTRADTLYVGTSPEAYETVQQAVNAARHRDEVVIEPGTYVEQVHIYPAAEDSFYVTIRAQDEQNRPRIRFGIGEPAGAPKERWENFAVIEIHNDMNDGPGKRCTDMRITLEGLEVIGTDDYTGALGVWTAMDDWEQRYYTGLFFRRNYFQTQRALMPPRVRGGGALWIGRRPDLTCLPNWRNCFEYQSLKWGVIEDNDVVAINGGEPNHYLSDGISTFHFVGAVQNNRVTSTAEGIHMSFARVTGEAPPFLQEPPFDQYTDSVVQHNLVYCNEQSGIHFTHGSFGTVRNNIVLRTWYQTNADASGISTGRSAGAAGFGDDSALDIEAQGGGSRMPTEATIHNNTIDRVEGWGIAMDDDNDVTLLGNIVARTRDVKPYFPEAQTVGIAVIHGDFDPDTIYTDYNVLWHNRNRSGVADYEPGGIYPSGLQGVNDVTEASPDGSCPHFIGGPLGEHMQSYMLKTFDPPFGCYAAASTPDSVSLAIDAGPTNPIYNDVQPPGLGGLRNDAGAYGGPQASWGDSGCLEYKVASDLACCHETR